MNKHVIHHYHPRPPFRRDADHHLHHRPLWGTPKLIIQDDIRRSDANHPPQGDVQPSTPKSISQITLIVHAYPKAWVATFVLCQPEGVLLHYLDLKDRRDSTHLPRSMQ
jgi:hypothetical protein